MSVIGNHIFRSTGSSFDNEYLVVYFHYFLLFEFSSSDDSEEEEDDDEEEKEREEKNEKEEEEEEEESEEQHSAKECNKRDSACGGTDKGESPKSKPHKGTSTSPT